MDDASSLGFVNDGFEVALHVTTNCADWTPASLAAFYPQQLAQFHAERPSVPPPQTNRTHCIVWSDYVTQPKVALANGIRFDTNYYYFPPNWVQDRPGLFTGSAMPMRFADVDGTTIDVYQATTQMTDESGQTYPFTSDTLFDRALGPLGYYGVFTANMHTDLPTEQPSDAAVNSAIARGIPVVSAKQMLDWLDGRNGSSFGSIAFDTGALTFTINPAAGSNGLTAMVPAQARGGALIGINRDGIAGDLHATGHQGRVLCVLRRPGRKLHRELRGRRHASAHCQCDGDAGAEQHRHDHVDDRRTSGLARRLRPLGIRAHQSRRGRRFDDDAQRGAHGARAGHDLLLPGDLIRRGRQHRVVCHPVVHDDADPVCCDRHDGRGFRRRHERRSGLHRADGGWRSHSESRGGI